MSPNVGFHACVVLVLCFVGLSQASTPALASLMHQAQAAQASAADTQPAATRPAVSPPGPDLQPIVRLINDRATGPARVRLRKYLQVHPDHPQATFLFGLTYHREQRYGQALPHYERALAIDPENQLPNHFRGWALYYLGDLDAAHTAFEAFLKQHPDEHDSHYALGLIALDQGDLERAAELFQRSIDLLSRPGAKGDPKGLSKARSRLGEIHDLNGDLLAAERELTAAVELFPDHYEAMYKLSRVLTKLGESEQAARMHQRYLATKERIRPGTSFPE